MYVHTFTFDPLSSFSLVFTADIVSIFTYLPSHFKTPPSLPYLSVPPLTTSSMYAAICSCTLSYPHRAPHHSALSTRAQQGGGLYTKNTGAWIQPVPDELRSVAALKFYSLYLESGGNLSI